MVPSADPAWDYEVSTGNWQLKIKKDGTFQAHHEGDSFTYRFNSLGFGRGSQYQKADLGELNFSRYTVYGNTIHWIDVYPDIDLSVHYLHNVLKVDVLVKNAFLLDLKTAVKEGRLDKSDYLTARFDIPQVLIRSQARQNDRDKDLYAESLDVKQPVSFEKDGKVLHALRPVETYLLDNEGKVRYDPLHPIRPIRSAQVWNLNQNASGMAEMSASVEDLAEQPEGDVVMDPGLIFYAGNSITRDTLLDAANPTVNNGSSTVLNLDLNPTNGSDAVLLGFEIKQLPAGVNVQSASVGLYLSNYSVLDAPSPARIHRVTADWQEAAATWNTHGGAYKAAEYYGNSYTMIAADQGTRVYFDATQACRALIASGTQNVLNRGFYLKFTATGLYEGVQFHSKEGANQPELHIKYYTSACFGADIGHASKTDAVVEAIEDRMKDDGLKVIRFFVDGGSLLQDGVPLGQTNMQRAVTQARDEMKMILCFPVGGATSTLAYKDYYVMARLNAVSSDIGLNKTIIGVELGNEEDLNGKWGASNGNAGSRYTGGQDFAVYYIAARDAIKASWPDVEIVSGGSISDHKTLTYGDLDYPGIGQYARAFICGFIDGVTALTPNKSLEKLPDTVAIHGYPSRVATEWYDDSEVSGGQREWFTRINTLATICNRGGYRPNFVQTEYGLGTHVKDVTDVPKGVIPSQAALNSATEVYQAVYYMRRALMDATTVGTGRAERWKYSLYYHHSYDKWLTAPPQENLVEDYGWIKEESTSAPKVIRKVGGILHNITEGGVTRPGLNDNINVWLPLTRSAIHATDQDYYLYCGWINSTGERWGAIWRIKYSPAT